MNEYRLLLSTLGGLEDFLYSELKEKLNVFIEKKEDGKVICKADALGVFKANFLLNSCERVSILLKDTEFSDLEDIYYITKSIPFEEFIQKNQSFRIVSERKGTHNFTSQDIAKITGQAVIDRYREKKKIRLKVDLEMPDIKVICKVIEKRILIGLDTTGVGLHKRRYKTYIHRAGLNPCLAYSLVKFSGWNLEYSLYDPFCGAATILIEAYREALKIPNYLKERELAIWNLKFLPLKEFKVLSEELKQKVNIKALKIYGSDNSLKHLEGAKINAQNLNLSLNLFLADAQTADFNYDFIVTNPPFGLRIGTKRKVKRVLENFKERLLSFKGKWKNAVILSPLKDLFKEFRIKKRVIYGNLPVYILKYR